MLRLRATVESTREQEDRHETTKAPTLKIPWGHHYCKVHHQKERKEKEISTCKESSIRLAWIHEWGRIGLDSATIFTGQPVWNFGSFCATRHKTKSTNVSFLVYTWPVYRRIFMTPRQTDRSRQHWRCQALRNARTSSTTRSACADQGHEHDERLYRAKWAHDRRE